MQYHPGISKKYLLRAIDSRGAADVLVGFCGTDEEGRRLLKNDPREFFTSGCDNLGLDGLCSGHPEDTDDLTLDE